MMYLNLAIEKITSQQPKQNRGKCNCARTPEVAAFEKEWLSWVHKGCPRKKDGTPRGAKPAMPKSKKAADAA